jgi:NADH:ubiquinone oxidoreductase subunit
LPALGMSDRSIARFPALHRRIAPPVGRGSGVRPLSWLKWLTQNRLGTHLFTRRRGLKVGEDELGNAYYRERGHTGDWRLERRWVIYAGDGDIEASTVAPGWNAWLHKNREKAPSEEPLKEKFWEKSHEPNLSGTAAAYLPPGHERRGGKRDPATGDYEAWRP